MSDLNERGCGDGQDGDELKNQTAKTVTSGSETSSQSQKDDGKGDVSNQGPKPTYRKYDLLDSLSKCQRGWVPNQEIVSQLLEMGISKNKAARALYHTGNNSAEAAITWLFKNAEDAEKEKDLGPRMKGVGAKSLGAELIKDEEAVGDEEEHEDEFKMVFVVNCSLEMGLGKTCAQVAHAALGLQLKLLQDEATYGCFVAQWIESGETKIVLKGESATQLFDLEKKASSLSLPSYLVQDAGRTQIPAGSTTVLAIFGRVEEVDQVTRSLRLL